MKRLKQEEGAYKKASRCIFQPDEVEDGYRDLRWLLEHRFEWCPIIEVTIKERTD